MSTSPLWVIFLAGGRFFLGDVCLAARVLFLSFEMLFLAVFLHLCAGMTGGRRVGLVAAAQFGQACLGRSSYFYPAETLLLGLLIPLLVGGIGMIFRREGAAEPLALLVLVYAGCFILGGSARAQHFPWYFVPILPGATLVASAGLVRIVEMIPGIPDRLKWARRWAVPEAVFVAAWVAIMWLGPLRTDAQAVLTGVVGRAEREQVYAAAAVWAGRNLDPGATVAAIEIGAVSLYLPQDVKVFDIYGLARKKEELRSPWLRLMDKHPPEIVFSRSFFSYAKTLDEQRPGRYAWHRFRSLDIGICSDLDGRMAPTLVDLDKIYDTIDLTRERPRVPRPSGR